VCDLDPLLEHYYLFIMRVSSSFLVVLISCLLLPLACHGGIPEVDEKIEAEAHRLWEKYCEGAANSNERSESGGPVEKNMYVYCKQSKATTEIPVEHEATFPPDSGRSGEEADNVVVFIRPPAVQYNHALTVKGQPAKAPKTIIYVKPVEYQHKVVNLRDDTDRAKSQKPTVYYLKKHHGAGGLRAQQPPALPESEADIDSTGITQAPAEQIGATPNPSSGYVYTAPAPNGNHDAHHLAQSSNIRSDSHSNGNGNGNAGHITVDLTAPAPHGEEYMYNNHNHPQQQQQHNHDRRRLTKVPYNRYRS